MSSQIRPFHRRRAAAVFALLAALMPAAGENAVPARPTAHVCYLDLQAAGAPACAAPKSPAAPR